MKNQIITQDSWETIETVKLNILRWSDGSPIYIDKDIYDSMEDDRESAREAGRRAKELFEPVIDIDSNEVIENLMLP